MCLTHPGPCAPEYLYGFPYPRLPIHHCVPLGAELRGQLDKWKIWILNICCVVHTQTFRYVSL